MHNPAVHLSVDEKSWYFSVKAKTTDKSLVRGQIQLFLYVCLKSAMANPQNVVFHFLLCLTRIFVKLYASCSQK